MSSNQTSDGKREGPSRDPDPGKAHSGEGMASLRPRLAQTLADSERLSAEKQADAMTTCIPPETGIEPDPDDSTQR